MSMLMHAQNCDIVLRPLITQSTNEDGSRYPQVVDYLTNRLRVLTSEAGGVGGMETRNSLWLLIMMLLTSRLSVEFPQR